jgi:hypothetical protein
MNMATVVAAIGLALMVLLNVAATVFIVRSDFETPLQKVLQFIFAWLIPLVGSTIVIAVLQGARSHRKPRFDSGASGDVWMPGMGPEPEGARGHHGGHGDGSGYAGHGSDAGHGGDAGFGGH